MSGGAAGPRKALLPVLIVLAALLLISCSKLDKIIHSERAAGSVGQPNSSTNNTFVVNQTQRAVIGCPAAPVVLPEPASYAFEGVCKLNTGAQRAIGAGFGFWAVLTILGLLIVLAIKSENAIGNLLLIGAIIAIAWFFLK